MNHSQAFYFYSSLLVSVYQLVIELAICLMTYTAVNLARKRKQEATLKWLLPLTLAQTIMAIYFAHGLAFRLLHFRVGLASTLSVYGFVVTGGLVSLYTAGRVLRFVKQSSPLGTAPP